MKFFSKQKWLIGILMILCLSLGFSRGDNQIIYPLGDIPLDAETYHSLLPLWPEDSWRALPVSYDARDYGYVSSAKNQGNCGSCWAFASVGAMESHIKIEYGLGLHDLSEQQQVSCNNSMLGCCGGNSTAPQYWQTVGPITETCFPYAESGTSCPTIHTVNCSAANSCPQFEFRVTNFHTVTPTTEAMKQSLYDDGPSYWRYDVYSDFNTFWSTASSGTVYTQATGPRLGGHAVLLIGWDDGKGAFLCKNSWGATGGPQGDGTFWIAYTGHANNLGFGMSNFSLSGWPYCYTASASTYTHEFTRIGMWLQGIASGSATCVNDALILGGVYQGNWILVKDIPSASVCNETVFYWGLYPSKDFTYVNDVGTSGTGTLFACTAATGTQSNEEMEIREIGHRKIICLTDNWGNEYNLNMSSAAGGRKLTGTRSQGSCDAIPIVTGMVRGNYFSIYVDIPSGDSSCSEGYLVIGDLSTQSGQYIFSNGTTGTISFTFCTSAPNQSLWSEK